MPRKLLAAAALLLLLQLLAGLGFAAAAAKSFKRSVVKKHSKATDCWMIYKGGVYNLNGYLKSNRHPAGNGVIQRYCGKDSTAAFNRAHRPSTAAMLKRYKIGKAVKG